MNGPMDAAAGYGQLFFYLHHHHHPPSSSSSSSSFVIRRRLSGFLHRDAAAAPCDRLPFTSLPPPLCHSLSRSAAPGMKVQRLVFTSCTCHTALQHSQTTCTQRYCCTYSTTAIPIIIHTALLVQYCIVGLYNTLTALSQRFRCLAFTAHRRAPSSLGMKRNPFPP